MSFIQSLTFIPYTRTLYRSYEIKRFKYISVSKIIPKVSQIK